MSFSAQEIKAARLHLQKSDPVMKKILKRVGPFKLKLQRNRFGALVRSIVSQQISVAAAKTIRERLIDLVEGDLTPEKITSCRSETLRTVGLSQQKVSYILDLSEKVASGEIALNRIGRSSDQEIIDQLTAVKGIGVWTAQMFLMFSLGRLDVLPVGDLAIRTAIEKSYGLAEHPTHTKCVEVAEPWRPYATVACWYLWRSLDTPSK